MRLTAIQTFIRRGSGRASKEFVQSQTSTSSVKYFLVRLGTSIGILSVPIVFIDAVGYPASIVGSSMEPTLHGKEKKWWKRDIVWLSRFGLDRPQIGQVFTFMPKVGPKLVEIPTGCCWMESDNPKNDFDSRLYGPVSKGLLTARATHIIWPPKRWRTIKTEVFEHSTVPVSKGYSLFGMHFPW